MDRNLINDLARRLAASVPPGIGTAREDLEKNFSALLQARLARLDLVTRDEFDVQRKVLERTREKLTTLEAQLARLEAEAVGATRDDG